MLKFFQPNVNMKVYLGFHSLKEEVWTERHKSFS